MSNVDGVILAASAGRLGTFECHEPNCNSNFTRACDLKKHKKIHSRQFKCYIDSCPYRQYGFTTNADRNRHIGDKHTKSPKLWACEYNCSYSSKRESNTKLHMEKRHGWTYIRSKNNGKNRRKSSDLPDDLQDLRRVPNTSSYPGANPDRLG